MSQHVSTTEFEKKSHHYHISIPDLPKQETSRWKRLVKAIPHDASPKQPDITKLLIKSNSSSGVSSAVSSMKSGKNKEVELKYGTVDKLVGEGGSSVVWRTSKGDQEVFALKSYKTKSQDKRQAFEANIIAEFKILGVLDSPHVMKVFDILQDRNSALYEVLELCEGGDLDMLLRSRKLSVREADCIFKQLFTGIEYLHSRGVVHRDIKPENLILTTSGTLKIADFGHSEVFTSTKYPEGKMIGGRSGTQHFLAPEMFTEEQFAAGPIDCWAAGIVYMELRGKRDRAFWEHANDQDKHYVRYVKERAEEDGFQQIQELGENWRANVIYSLLDPKAERRLTAYQFMKSEWAYQIVMCGEKPASSASSTSGKSKDQSASSASSTSGRTKGESSKSEV